MTDGVEPPGELALFPIRGCILPPGEHLPLNVFEPRYLNMIDDAMAGDRYLGMIQPADGGTPDLPALERVGTAGRIVSHSETEDGRYLIVVSGVMRFTMTEELNRLTPYRVAKADYRGFERDLDPQPLSGGEAKDQFLSRLRRFFTLTGLEADWDSLERAPLNAVVDKVAMAAPFDPDAKQALLTAPTPADRAERLSAFMDAALDSADPSGGL
ncbi:MAG: LON peptidase substrate-binding domain-containing protein [Oceanicaulis sp.]